MKTVTRDMRTRQQANPFIVFCLAVFLGLSFFLTSNSAEAAKKDKAVRFMEKVAADMMKAVRSGDKKNLARVIRKYADLKGIGLYSLGEYARRLPKRKRSSYYTGMTKFMARYLMDQSKQYKITKTKVQAPSFKENGERIVDTQVTLQDGSTYEVQWRLTKHKRTFKIRDARILGLWLVPYQRDLFSDFVNKRNGNVNDLVLALHYN